MRVLHIGSGNLYGGVEKLLVTLSRCRELAPSMESEFTVCFDGRLRDELQAAGSHTHDLGPVRVRNLLSIGKARRNLRKLLAESRFDVAICHSGWTQAIFGPVVRERHLPLMAWMHSPPARSHWLECWARRAPADFVICNSRFTARGFAQCNPGVPHKVLYCPVPAPEPSRIPADLSAVRSEMKTPRDSVVIIQVSRMERLKGHRLHLEALARMRDLPEWTCWFVGGAQRACEREYFGELQEAAERLRILDRVRFLGHRFDVERLMAAADIFCQPNIDVDSFGIAFVEALWAGLPVVTSAIGGAPEIVDDVCGILVPPGDTASLTAALELLVADHGTRNVLSQAGSRRADELCAPARQLPRLAEVIEGAVGSRIAA